MSITVEGPGGASVDFPDGTDAATIHKVMSDNFAPQSPGLLRSAEYGAVSGPGQTGDLRNMISPYIPEAVKQFGGAAANLIPGLGPMATALQYAPTSEQTRGAYQTVTGRDLPPPETLPEKMVAGGVSNLTNPASYIGPGGLGLKAAGALASGALGEAGENIAGTPGRLAGSSLGGIAAAKTLGPRQLTASVTGPELKAAAQSGGQYGGYRGALASGLEIAPKEVANRGLLWEQELRREGFAPKLAPATYDVVKELQSPPQGATFTALDMDQLRKTLRNIAGQTNEGRPSPDAAAAQFVLGRVEPFAANPPAHAIVAGNPKDYANAVGEADANYRSFKKLENIDERLARADRLTKRNISTREESQIKSKIGSILDNPRQARQFTPDEQQQIELINSGNLPSNILRGIGKYGVGHLFPIAGHIAAAGATGGLSIPISAAMYGANLASSAITRNRAAKLGRMITEKSPLYQQRQAQLPIIPGAPSQAQLLRSAVLGLK